MMLINASSKCYAEMKFKITFAAIAFYMEN